MLDGVVKEIGEHLSEPQRIDPGLQGHAGARATVIRCRWFRACVLLPTCSTSAERSVDRRRAIATSGGQPRVRNIQEPVKQARKPGSLVLRSTVMSAQSALSRHAHCGSAAAGRPGHGARGRPADCAAREPQSTGIHPACAMRLPRPSGPHAQRLARAAAAPPLAAAQRSRSRATVLSAAVPQLPAGARSRSGAPHSSKWKRPGSAPRRHR